MFSFGRWSKLLGSIPELIAMPYFCISLFFIQKQLWEVVKIASVVTSNSVWKISSSAFYNYNLSTLLNIEKAKSADEKFNKLKVLYGKLRQDHIELLRKVRFLFFFFFLLVNSRVTYSIEVRGDDLVMMFWAIDSNESEPKKVFIVT